jgi:hypothetical protein
MAWTGKVLSCTTISERNFTLTFYADGAMWTADDQEGVLEAGAGNYVGDYTGQDLPATACFFEGRQYLLVVADVATLAKGDQGSGSIMGAEDFQWVCSAVFD